MKNFFTAALLLSSFGTLVAQTQDSIRIKENGFYDTYELQLRHAPLLMVHTPLSNYTQTQLDATHKSLNFKRVQTAERINQINFSTQGIFNIDPTLRLFGGISIHRTREYDLGYNASAERTEFQNVLSPNYFLAPKKGDWNNQSYQVFGGVTKSFYKNFLVGATVTYNNSKMTRDTDPRPELTIHQIGGTAHAGYQWHGHTLFGFLGLDRETQTNGIMYVNALNNSSAFPETYIRFSSGYGRIVNNNSFNNHLYRTLTQKGGGGYQYQWNKNQVNATYSYAKSMKDLYNKDENNNIYLENNLISFKYRTVTHDLGINYYHNGTTHDFYANAKYTTAQGDNYSVIENGQNYRSQQNFVHLNTALIKQRNQRIEYHLALQATYSNQRFTDLLGYTDKKINALEAQIIAGRDLFQSQDHLRKFYVEAGVGAYQPVMENLVHNPISNSTLFKDGVLMPDHAYDVTTRFQSTLKLNYRFHLQRNRTLNIFANYQATTALGNDYQKYDALLNTQHNHLVQAGISISY